MSAPAIRVAAADGAADAAWLSALWRAEWGGTSMVAGGRTRHLRDLEALIAWRGPERVGAATYAFEDGRAELWSLNALIPRAGVGSALVAAAAARTAEAGGHRLTLCTTNDNVGALAFYQRLGFRLVEIRPGAVDRSRAAKPTIPVVGENGLVLHDEWWLDVAVDPGPSVPPPPVRPPPARAVALLVRGGHVAVVERSHAGRTWWTLPGAAVGAGESAVEAAARACRDEAGVRAAVTHEALAVWVAGRLERVFEAVAAEDVAPLHRRARLLAVGDAAAGGVHPAAVASLLAAQGGRA